MKERIPIPDDLAATVMFASDRTCCICRQERKVQIHHIDEDPTNNNLDNLAVICLHCHSDAHTTGAFVRSMTPELIRLYNSSWRDIVRLKLLPATDSVVLSELAAEAFLEVSLDCHSWKILFMNLRGPNLPEGAPGEHIDVWDALVELWLPAYEDDSYRQYSPLFGAGIRRVCSRFDRSLQLFGSLFPDAFKVLLVRAARQLETEARAYEAIPQLERAGILDASNGLMMFQARFTGVAEVLRSVSRDADRWRQRLSAPPNHALHPTPAAAVMRRRG